MEGSSLLIKIRETLKINLLSKDLTPGGDPRWSYTFGCLNSGFIIVRQKINVETRMKKRGYDPMGKIREEEKKLGQLKYDPNRGEFYYKKSLSELFPPIPPVKQSAATDKKNNDIKPN